MLLLPRGALASLGLVLGVNSGPTIATYRTSQRSGLDRLTASNGSLTRKGRAISLAVGQ